MAETQEDKPYFDEAKLKKAIEWINQRCPNLKCECCGTNQWQITPDITAAPVFRGGMMLGGSVSPTFSLVCTNCGNTKFFNALLTGVLIPEKSEEKDAKSSSQ